MVEHDTSFNDKFGDKRSQNNCFADFPGMHELPADIFIADEPTLAQLRSQSLKQMSGTFWRLLDSHCANGPRQGSYCMLLGMVI